MGAPDLIKSGSDAGACATVRARILERIPQQAPFRFVDSIDELSPERARGSYRFRADEFFYAGHFPEQPVTPGVILIECMAQIVLVPLALFLSASEAEAQAKSDANAATSGAAGPGLPFFAEADQVEFNAPVRPGDRVLVSGERIYFRRGKLKCRVEMSFADGSPVASAVLAGVQVAAASDKAAGETARKTK
ncbi:MAG: beta-hydroxyacyl-ACP dehydratase [bacterium]|nr:beta-hydroxyacyl-ACP dehydratase [bacterium]